MVSFNSPSISQQSNTGVFIYQHITVPAVADATGYHIQYLTAVVARGTIQILIKVLHTIFNFMLNYRACLTEVLK